MGIIDIDPHCPKMLWYSTNSKINTLSRKPKLGQYGHLIGMVAHVIMTLKDYGLLCHTLSVVYVQSF